MGMDEPTDHAQAEPTPELGEVLQAFRAQLHANASSALGTGRAFRDLLSADLSLARGALARAFALTGVAIALGGSCWLLLMASLIALLQHFGASWLLALSLATGLSLLGTACAAWFAMRYFHLSGMQATRRQLAKFDLFAAPPPEDNA
jgi:hypothetical protein